ncbi:hypothetical protein [Leptospira ryugenii]|uniref:hypothetical protein n=1 Tax=Leptospira ryugenii TaxID=1917863 RepID=UPI00107F408E|nr:hypothetical protein [Leptospira ryugenii]
MARPDDFVHLTGNPHPSYFHFLKRFGIEPANIWKEGDLLSPSIQWKEWGRLHDLDNGVITENLDKRKESQYLNSKITQTIWKESLPEYVIRAKILHSEDGLFDYLQEHSSTAMVVKGRYGIAGRNHLILENPGQVWKLQQIKHKLFDFPIFVEEWFGKERFYDFSSLWDFDEVGPQGIELTHMYVDEKGGFLGISISKENSAYLQTYFPEIQKVIQSVYQLLEVPYQGPLAMDGFLYKKNGTLHIQCFSEINFRYSIGRVLYEFKKRRNTFGETVGFLFLPVRSVQLKAIESWLEAIESEHNCFLNFVTPFMDQKNKAYQNVGLYWETKGDESSLLEEIRLSWRDTFV